jgi:hypothetical protein
VADYHDEIIDNLIEQNELLKAQIERLQDTVIQAQNFIDHHSNCAVFIDWGKDCSCGYNNLWSKLETCND